MYEVCKSFYGRNDPTFGDNCSDPIDPQTGLCLPVNSETENHVFVSVFVVEILNFILFISLSILFQGQGKIF